MDSTACEGAVETTEEKEPSELSNNSIYLPETSLAIETAPFGTIETSPNLTALDENVDKIDSSDSVTIKPTFKSALQAKKRLQAFSTAKQAPTTPRKDEKCADDVACEHADKTSPKKSKKELYPDERAKAVIQEIEAIKKEEAEQSNNSSFRAESHASRSRSRSVSIDKQHFIKREIKCRNFRRSDSLTKRSPSPENRSKRDAKFEKTEQNSSKKFVYPKDWTEYKKVNLTSEEDRQLKIKCTPTQRNHEKNVLARFLNFEVPSPTIGTYRCNSDTGELIVPFNFVRFTTCWPTISYSANFRAIKQKFVSRQELFKYIPIDRRNQIEKIFNTNSKCQPSNKLIPQKLWYPKNWKTGETECKQLEKSVGLSFLQNYSEEDEDDDREQTSSMKANSLEENGEKPARTENVHETLRAIRELEAELKKRQKLMEDLSEEEADEKSQKKKKAHKQKSKKSKKKVEDDSSDSSGEENKKKKQKKLKKQKKAKRERKNSSNSQTESEESEEDESKLHKKDKGEGKNKRHRSRENSQDGQKYKKNDDKDKNKTTKSEKDEESEQDNSRKGKERHNNESKQSKSLDVSKIRKSLDESPIRHFKDIKDCAKSKDFEPTSEIEPFKKSLDEFDGKNKKVDENKKKVTENKDRSERSDYNKQCKTPESGSKREKRISSDEKKEKNESRKSFDESPAKKFQIDKEKHESRRSMDKSSKERASSADKRESRRTLFDSEPKKYERSQQNEVSEKTELNNRKMETTKEKRTSSIEKDDISKSRTSSAEKYESKRNFDNSSKDTAGSAEKLKTKKSYEDLNFKNQEKSKESRRSPDSSKSSHELDQKNLETVKDQGSSSAEKRKNSRSAADSDYKSLKFSKERTTGSSERIESRKSYDFDQKKTDLSKYITSSLERTGSRKGNDDFDHKKTDIFREKRNSSSEKLESNKNYDDLDKKKMDMSKDRKTETRRSSDDFDHRKRDTSREKPNSSSEKPEFRKRYDDFDQKKTDRRTSSAEKPVFRKNCEVLDQKKTDTSKERRISNAEKPENRRSSEDFDQKKTDTSKEKRTSGAEKPTLKKNDESNHKYPETDRRASNVEKPTQKTEIKEPKIRLETEREYRRTSFLNDCRSSDRKSMEKNKNDSKRINDVKVDDKLHWMGMEKVQIKVEKVDEEEENTFMDYPLLQIKIKQEPKDDEPYGGKRKRLSSENKDKNNKEKPKDDVNLNLMKIAHQNMEFPLIKNIATIKRKKKLKPTKAEGNDGSPDTDEYYSNWESDVDIPPPVVPRDKMNNSWESDEEIFERGVPSIPKTPYENMNLEIPLNIKLFSRRVHEENFPPTPVEEKIVKVERKKSEERRVIKEGKWDKKPPTFKVKKEIKLLKREINEDSKLNEQNLAKRIPYSDPEIELEILKQERENLSEQRRKLEIQKIRIKELELNTIKEVEKQLERGTKRRRANKTLELDLGWMNDTAGLKKRAAAASNRKREQHMKATSPLLDLTKVKTEKFENNFLLESNFVSVSSSTELESSFRSVSSSALENQYEEFLKAVTSTTSGKKEKKKHRKKVSSSSSSSDSSDSSSSDSSPRQSKKRRRKNKKVKKPRKQTVVIANLDDLFAKPPTIKDVPQTNDTVFKSLPTPPIPLPTIETKSPLPVPSPSLEVMQKPLSSLIMSPVVTKINHPLATSSPAPFNNIIETLPNSPLSESIKMISPVVQRVDPGLIQFASPITDVSMDSLVSTEQQDVNSKPFVFTSMVLPSKKQLTVTCKLNFNDDSDEEKAERSKKLTESLAIVKDVKKVEKTVEKALEKTVEEKPKESEPKPPPSEKKPSASKKTPSKTASKDIKPKTDSNDKRKSTDRRLPPKKRNREISPGRRRSPRRRSPNRRRSPAGGRRNYSPRRRSVSPIRRKRNSSLSPPRRKSVKRSKSPGSPTKRSKSPERNRNSRTKSPVINSVNSPLERLKKSVADSTISDDLLLPHLNNVHNVAIHDDYDSPVHRFFDRCLTKPVDSPKRIPLDVRINQVLGLKEEEPKQISTIYGNYPSYPSQYPQPYHHYGITPEFNQIHNKNMPNKVVQVGNMLQIVPREDLPERMQKILQVGNMLQIVPGQLPLAPPPPPPEPVKQEEIELAEMVVVSPEKPSADAVMKIKAAERRAEREKRRLEREKRRKEKEKRRKEKEKQKQNKLKIRTENMIKKALEMEEETEIAIDEDESDCKNESNIIQWPPAPLNLDTSLKEAGKSILMKGGFNSSRLDDDFNRTEKKFVVFADGVRPGEGTSTSGGEELSSPPPATAKLPKEKRYKKTKVPKRSKKKKIKVKVIKKEQQAAPEDSEDDDNLPPPPPPPGSPPPHLYPPRLKSHTINNIHPAYASNIVSLPPNQNNPANFQALYRPPIPIIMPPPHHHGPPHHGPPHHGPPHMHHHPPPHCPPPIHHDHHHGPPPHHCDPHHCDSHHCNHHGHNQAHCEPHHHHHGPPHHHHHH